MTSQLLAAQLPTMEVALDSYAKVRSKLAWFRGFYTGVGSRETPEDILLLMTRLAQKLSELGWILRSGGADGADSAFYQGSKVIVGGDARGSEIYLPWAGFNRNYHASYIVAPNLTNYKQAELIASTIHPVWDKLKPGAKALHTRNVYQVLGSDLSLPSKALICWGKPIGDGTLVKGGTGTAVALARKCNVPVINLFYKENIDKALSLLAAPSIENLKDVA